MARHTLLVYAAVVLIAPLGSAAAQRRVALVIDTSGSMRSNDKARNTVRLAQVLSDLMDDDDAFATIRMPKIEPTCGAPADDGLMTVLTPKSRQSFKQHLSAALSYDNAGDPTLFAAPIHTAQRFLGADSNVQRMLLIVSDSDGFGNCRTELTRDLLALRQSGATIAAVNIQGSASLGSNDFFHNAAFAEGDGHVGGRGFVEPAHNPEELTRAVARVYQSFLGARKPQMGQITSSVRFTIQPHVREAFLVVIVDTPLDALDPVSGNPTAASLNLDYRGGGQALGLDNRTRSYRMARLERPSPGTWLFDVRGGDGTGSWLLLQDFAIGARLVSSRHIAADTVTNLQVELVDEITGKRINDAAGIAGLDMRVNYGGQSIPLHDDGKEGDDTAEDGIFSGKVTFSGKGSIEIPIYLQSTDLDRRASLSVDVTPIAWVLHVKTPPNAVADKPLVIAVAIESLFGNDAKPRPPTSVFAQLPGTTLSLRDDGTNGDAAPHDGIYTGTWPPTVPGLYDVDYIAQGGSAADSARQALRVDGYVHFGGPVTLDFGSVHSNTAVLRDLDLSSATFKGTGELEITSSFVSDGATLELQSGDDWRPLGTAKTALRLDQSIAQRWPLRLRVGSCPAACGATEKHTVTISAVGPDGKVTANTDPLTIVIIADTWLKCWWWAIVTVAGLALASFVAYGIISPSRFQPRLGFVLSPDADLNEGFFHPIRAISGTGAGFYRDARVFVCENYRLSGRPQDAVAMARAAGTHVRIRPIPGRAVWRQSLDGTWEQLPAQETVGRCGVTYRNDAGTLYFEMRNG